MMNKHEQAVACKLTRSAGVALVIITWGIVKLRCNDGDPTGVIDSEKVLVYFLNPSHGYYFNVEILSGYLFASFSSGSEVIF